MRFPPSSADALVFGTTRGLDSRGSLKELLPCFDTLIATRYVENPRSVPPETIAEEMLALSGRRGGIAAEPARALAGGARADGFRRPDLWASFTLPWRPRPRAIAPSISPVRHRSHRL